MYEKTALADGLRIVTSTMPHTHSVSVAIFVGVGSRYEKDEEAGLSHFIEHLMFKGTIHRPSAKEISESIESLGGLLNAGTDRELTVYTCKVASLHFPVAVDVLTDMLQYSKFDPVEIEKERKVIIEELHMVQDDPHDWVDVLIDEVLWPGQPLGRDVAGTVETVSTFGQQTAFDYLGRHYAPANTVVSVAGNLRHEEAVEAFIKKLRRWPASRPTPWFPAHDQQKEPRYRVEYKKTEQAHLCLALHGFSNLHPDRFILDLINVILGEGMSSRLFLEIREKRGLAYDVHSYVSHYLDVGSITIYAGVEPKRIESAIGAILEEVARLRQPIPQEELTKAREFSKGRILLRMEDTRAVASWLGGQELLTDRILTVEEVVDILDAITVEDLQRVANQLFVGSKLNLAVVGPFKNEGRFASLLSL